MHINLIRATNCSYRGYRVGQQIVHKLEHLPGSYIRAATAIHCIIQWQCMHPRCRAMQCNTKTGKRNQQVHLTAPGKVWLWLDAIQHCCDGHAPCYIMQPSSGFAPKHKPASWSMHGIIPSMQHDAIAMAAITILQRLLWPYFCKQPQLQCSASATASDGASAFKAMQFKAMQLKAMQPKVMQMQFKAK